MIIDCHIHMGVIGPFNMPEAMVMASLAKYRIDFALVSNIEGVEVDGEQVLIPPEHQVPQQLVNERTLRFVRAHPDRLGALLWIKPTTEGCTPAFEALLADNLDVVYGLKVHPFLSNISFGSPEVEKYIQLAEKYDLVVVSHTAIDDHSSPRVMYEVAQKFPRVNFVMYHMGLATDNQEAIELISRLPNLFGDSCWVKPEATLAAIRKCGSEKILFGTDNPINGPDTYNDPVFYNHYFDGLQNEIPQAAYENFMFINAIRLFKLKQFTTQARP
ncbi:MAG: amidohydrolase family protein [Anaerolineales bacterium]|nr:amidohydrolase family protein [Anaerolineales bacterium]